MNIEVLNHVNQIQQFEYIATTGIAAQAVSFECFAMHEQDLILANGVISKTNKIKYQIILLEILFKLFHYNFFSKHIIY